MSTRSFIAIQKTARKEDLIGIYCHQAGSPKGVGRLLFTHYKEREVIDNLFKLGSLSILGDTPDTCVKMPNAKPVQETDLNSWAFDIQGDLDYIYIFTHDNFWLVFDCETGKTDLLESVVSQDICRYIPKLMADLAKDGYNNEVISRNCGAYGKVISFDGSRLEIDILGQVFVIYPKQSNVHPIFQNILNTFNT